MLKQSPKSLPKLSSEKNFRRKLRKGQQQLLDECKSTKKSSLNVKWPGGYGKSLGIALAFRAMVDRGICDRLLLVVANDTQRDQMINDFQHDCLDVALEIPQCWRVTSDVATFRACRTGVSCVFVTTIQQVSASAKAGLNYIRELMLQPGNKWMLAADEYHHYAEEADWGTSLSNLTEVAAFVLATSATPYRDGKDTIFGPPEMIVSYSEGVREQALKPIARRCYEYRIDYIDRDGQPVQFTSDELRLETEGLKRVSVYEAKKCLRMSGKYVIPIVSEPMFRLRTRRLQTGLPLQMLVRAMSCNHAEETCKQIKSICEDMTVDWIGTGPDGRSDADNQKIKAAFCPRKDSQGNRPKPELDILVQVGMADEGFDSVMVAEIVDLHIVTLDGAATKTKQFYKRGCRAVGDEVLYINVGTDHPLAALEGSQVADWIDSNKTIPEAKKKEPGEDPGDVFDPWDLPEFLPETKEQFIDAELTDMQVDQHPAFSRFCEHSTNEIDFQPSDDQLRRWFRQAMSEQNKPDASVSIATQRSFIQKVIGQIAHAALRSFGVEFEKSRIGDYSKRINQRIVRQFGKRRDEMLPDELACLYGWVKELHASVRDGEVPTWLK